MKNWRTSVIGFLLMLAMYGQQVGPNILKMPETRQDWWSLGMGLLLFAGSLVMRDPEWLKTITGQGGKGPTPVFGPDPAPVTPPSKESGK